MSGRYGSVLDYIRAYDHFGGKPPIPENADVERGGYRPIKSRLLGLVLGAVVLVTMALLGFVMADVGRLPIAGTMFLAGILAMALDVMLVTPIQDWYDDTPRRGLGSAEYGIVPVYSGDLE